MIDEKIFSILDTAPEKSLTYKSIADAVGVSRSYAQQRIARMQLEDRHLRVFRYAGGDGKQRNFRSDRDSGIDSRERIIDAIDAFVALRGVPPCVQELANNLSLSRTSVIYHLHRLEEMGLVEKAARGIYRTVNGGNDGEAV